MGKIQILDESVSNIIAAGEVVENPASMVKELLENSLDAKSKTIQIHIKNGGRDVTIIDDGIGMNSDDLLLSIERHATSKISKKDDLYNLYTYGFRGEALSSISAVSKITLSSRTAEDNIGAQITVLAGKVTSFKEVQRNIGTTIEIKELFFNTPARLKFLRKPTTEYNNIKDIIIQEALANPETAILLTLDGKPSIKTTGNGIENTLVEIFGKTVLKNVKKFPLGFLGNGALYKSSKDSIFTFVNGRMVKSKIIENAVIDSYYTKLMKGKYPFALIFLKIDPKEIDVNVHPSKKIVKFSDEDQIYKTIIKEIEKAFERDDEFVSPTLDQKIENLKNTKKQFLDFSEFEKFTPIKTENKQLLNLEKENLKENYNNLEEKILDKNFNIMEDSKTIPTTEYIAETTDEIIEPIDSIEKKIEKRNIDFKVIGQLFNTFILVERNGLLEIYDQHIVHERIIYEELKAKYYGTEVSRQQLLVPIRILVDPREKTLIFENEENFVKAGFEIDNFSENEILLRAVPMIEFKDSNENIFKEILKSLKENKNMDIREKILISMSCRGAIKANEALKLDEMEKLIKKLHEIGEYTCPHGRPIIVKISLDDLEKLFRRK